ncbi:MAG: nucleotidyltransferase family protein [Ruminococcus sp.]|jgi:predicted nucleotidyltransferase|nr:nucleotidyltransferase family protein [Ruminococcus sp.]
MKTYGIISEYNPFHNGHKYHIEKVREAGATHIVAVMSGNFVQRGDVALIDKFKRAEIAVNNGVDLVLEMPVVYSLCPAELFSRAGIMMLGSLGCVDGISFGCENTDVSVLRSAADAAAKAATPEKVMPLLEQGIPFPAAMQQILSLDAGPLIAEVFEDPNNTLAAEYIKSMNFLGLDFEILPIKRTGTAHDSKETNGNFASASAIRQMIEDEEDFSYFVPQDTLDAVREYEEKELLCYFDNLGRELIYAIRKSTPSDIAKTPDVGQGLENRIYEAGRAATSVFELLEMIKTKRYTMAHIRRVLLAFYMGIFASDIMVPPTFGRVLALNGRGAEILAASEEKNKDGANRLAVPFTADLKEIHSRGNMNAKRFAQLAALSSDLYTLASRKIRPSGYDYTAKIVKQN